MTNSSPEKLPFFLLFHSLVLFWQWFFALSRKWIFGLTDGYNPLLFHFLLSLLTSLPKNANIYIWLQIVLNHYWAYAGENFHSIMRLRLRWHHAVAGPYHVGKKILCVTHKRGKKSCGTVRNKTIFGDFCCFGLCVTRTVRVTVVPPYRFSKK